MTPSTLVRLSGRDSLDLLHRLSTHDLRALSPGRCRTTLFCDFRGRLSHRVTVAVTADGSVWLMRDDAPGSDLASHLERHLFRENVRIEDLSSQLPVRGTASSLLEAGRISEREGRPQQAQVDPDFSLELGEPIPPASERERARIAAGRPAHGHEIHPDFNPFEVGLGDEVHLSKGCYTGQEALLRMVTYGGVRRRLVRVRGRGPLPSAGAELTRDGRRAGKLTSAVPEEGAKDSWIGLAVVRFDPDPPKAPLDLPDGARIEAIDLLPSPAPAGLP